MKIKKRTRLLAGLLAIVMVLSMVMVTPGKAGNKAVAAGNAELTAELYTGGVRGFRYGVAAETISVGRVLIDGANIQIANPKVVINNGTYDLDPDDRIVSGGKYTFTITFTSTNVSQFNNVSSAKVYAGVSQYDTSSADYLKAEVKVTGNTVVIKGNLEESGRNVTIADINAVGWKINYGEAMNTKPILFGNVPFAVSDITWYYTNNAGLTKTPALIANSETNGKTAFYMAEFTLTANVGYVFPQFTPTQLAYLKYANITYNTVTSTDGRTLQVTVSGITTAGGTADANSITSISFDTQRSIPYLAGQYAGQGFGQEWVAVADVKKSAFLPRWFTVGVGQIASGLPISIEGSTTLYGDWEIYGEGTGAYRNSMFKMQDDAIIVAGKKYYAVLPFDTIRNALATSNYNDGYHLIDAYAHDDKNFSGDNIHTSGWVIEFTIMPSGQSMIPNKMNASFLFDNSKLTYTVAGGEAKDIYSCATGLYGLPGGLTGNAMTNANTGGIVVGQHIYEAQIKGDGKTSLDGPVTYTYYSTNAGNQEQAQKLDLTLSITPSPIEGNSPDTTMTVVGKSSDILDTSKVWTVWKTSTGVAEDKNIVTGPFETGKIYSSYTYIPIKKGTSIYSIAQVTAVVNGQNAVAFRGSGEFIDYIVVMGIYTGNVQKTGFITKTSCAKKMYFNETIMPLAGEVIPRVVTLTPSSARFAQFVSIVWKEDGKPCQSVVFQAGHAYTAEITLLGTRGGITGDYNIAANLVGDARYVYDAKAESMNQTMVFKYQFPLCQTRVVSSVSECIIELKNGTSIADFVKEVNKPHIVTVAFVDGTTKEMTLTPGYSYGTFTYANFSEQIAETYKAEGGYDPNKREEQIFTVKGIIDLSMYNGSKAQPVTLTVKVGKGKDMVVFDPNGGSFYGKSVDVDYGKPYNFNISDDEIVRSGYNFEGWYSEKEGGTLIEPSTPYMGYKTLYAHWSVITVDKVAKPTVTSPSKGKVKVKFVRPQDCDGIQVRISLDKKSWKSYTLNSSTTKNITGLKSGKKYYVKVRAFKIDSAGKRVYGLYSTTITIKVK